MTLDAEPAAAWAGDRRGSDDLKWLARHDEIGVAVQSAVNEANALVSQAESIRSLRIL